MRKFICAVLILAAAISALSACGSGVPASNVSSAADLSGKAVGVLSGSVAEGSEELAAYSQDITSYETEDELLDALLAGDISCAVLDFSCGDALQKKSSKVRVLDEYFSDETYSFIAAKENIALTEDINAALSAMTEDGSLQAIIDSYKADSGYKYKASSGQKEKSISLLTSVDSPPYVTESDSGYTGLNIDIASAICDRLGVALEIKPLRDGQDIVASIQSGRADIAMGAVKNDADAELVDFSEPYFTSTQVILVRR